MDGSDALRVSAAASGYQPWWPAVEASPRWIRVRLGDALVADSRRALLLIQYGRPPMLPTYYLPHEDVVEGVLKDAHEGADGSTYWAVSADECRVEDGAWTHPAPSGPLASLAGMVTFAWADELTWYEEEERLFAHARDPHKRVDVAPSSRHVRVEVDGVVVADSTTPVLLFETALPVRFYLPADDVRTDLLEPSSTTSQCPYKGTARYWSLRTGDAIHRDILWSYPDPIPENPRIRNLISFFNERVDLIVDGQALERPLTPWSTPPS